MSRPHDQIVPLTLDSLPALAAEAKRLGPQHVAALKEQAKGSAELLQALSNLLSEDTRQLLTETR